MKKIVRFASLGLMILVTQPLMSQTTIDGEIRPRFEFRDGFQKPLVDTLKPVFVALQRSRLSFDYKSKILNMRLTMQDSRIWGESTTKTSVSKFEVYEAWAEWLITSGFSAQIGRQALKYDDSRLFSPSNWSNTGNAHDLVLLKYKPISSLQIHGGFAYNNSKDTLLEVDYTVKKMYKNMGFLWISNDFKTGLTTSGIAVFEGIEKTGQNQEIYPRVTEGIYANYQIDSTNLFFNAQVYLQQGRSSDTLSNTLHSYMFAAKVGYKVYKSNAVFLGVDYYSGTKKDEATGNSYTFEKLYGSNHSFNGGMEYFTKVKKGGLLDIYGGVNGNITGKLSVSGTYHLFNLAQEMIVSKKNVGKKLGSELDIVFDYKVSKEIAVQGGYCLYFANENIKKMNKISVDANFPQYAYLMFTFKPNFYKTPVEPKN
jgi:hypothetical protein